MKGNRVYAGGGLGELESTAWHRRNLFSSILPSPSPPFPDSIGQDVLHPARQPFVIPLPGACLISTSMLQGPWEQQLRPAQLCRSPKISPESLWPPESHAAACSEQRRKKPSLSLLSLSLSLLQQSGRQPEKAQYLPPSFPAASTHLSRGREEEARSRPLAPELHPLLLSLRGILWRVEERRGTLQARVQRESSWLLLSLSPSPAFNQEGVPKFTAPFFIVGGMRGTSSLS